MHSTGHKTAKSVRRAFNKSLYAVYHVLNEVKHHLKELRETGNKIFHFTHSFLIKNIKERKNFRKTAEKTFDVVQKDLKHTDQPFYDFLHSSAVHDHFIIQLLRNY